MKSIRSGGTWSSATLVSSSSNRPDTDDTWIVYDANRAGATGQDVYFQPVAGGPETQLAIASVQQGPSISRGVIAFESRAAIADPGDIFIYVVATNTMFRVTDTPIVDEVLTDISVLPSGDVRVVWAVNDGLVGDFNIYARTFRVPLGTPAQQIADLATLIRSFGLPAGIENSLLAKLRAADTSLASGNTTDTCNKLQDLINEASAQSGKSLQAAQATRIITDAQAIRSALGCS